jgi:hypothetical protein
MVMMEYVLTIPGFGVMNMISWVFADSIDTNRRLNRGQKAITVSRTMDEFAPRMTNATTERRMVPEVTISAGPSFSVTMRRVMFSSNSFDIGAQKESVTFAFEQVDIKTE